MYWRFLLDSFDTSARRAGPKLVIYSRLMAPDELGSCVIALFADVTYLAGSLVCIIYKYLFLYNP